MTQPNPQPNASFFSTQIVLPSPWLLSCFYLLEEENWRRTDNTINLTKNTINFIKQFMKLLLEGWRLVSQNLNNSSKNLTFSNLSPSPNPFEKAELNFAFPLEEGSSSSSQNLNQPLIQRKTNDRANGSKPTNSISRMFASSWDYPIQMHGRLL